jgi:hypothetical protein
MSALTFAGIAEHGFGCFEIGVKVTQDGKAHSGGKLK